VAKSVETPGRDEVARLERTPPRPLAEALPVSSATVALRGFQLPSVRLLRVNETSYGGRCVFFQ
jgi:hypothetical protein